jgi:hypothetical protein
VYAAPDRLLSIGDDSPCVCGAPLYPRTHGVGIRYLYVYDTVGGTLAAQVYAGITPSCLHFLDPSFLLAAQGTNAVWALDAALVRPAM